MVCTLVPRLFSVVLRMLSYTVSDEKLGRGLRRLYCSLVPRPFPPPVFDRLKYANTEGEGLGDLVMCSYIW